VSDGSDDVDALAKPRELLALHDTTTEMFGLLRLWFGIGSSVTLDLRTVDSAVTELGDPQMVIALAMRKLQALHLLATPGVMTTTDVVVAIVNDLERALIQAPNLRLRRQAASTDWDSALAALESGDLARDADVPAEVDEADPETERFRALHARLHAAVHAVIDASGGEIRYFV